MSTTPYTEDLLVVIVLYRATLEESNSYQAVLRGFRKYVTVNQQVDLLVINNGPQRFNCVADKSVFRLHYIERLDNPGVSKAYNLAAELANSLQKRWLYLLDQDTKLPDDFWSHYSYSMHTYPDMPVYAPKLYAGKVLASPCGYRFYRGYPFNDLTGGVTVMKGKNVLNSGLVVSIDAFRRVEGYDETVPLYFSDFVFFDRLKRVYHTFAVVEVKLLHDLSSSDYSNRKVAMYRFALYCLGARAAAKRNYTRLLVYFITVGARSLLMNRRFGTLEFSKVFLGVWFSNK